MEGMPGIMAKPNKKNPHNAQHPPVMEQLAEQMLPQVHVGRTARDQDTRSRGTDQRRNLADQSIAHRQQGVRRRRLAHRKALLSHADDETRDDIDRRNQQSRDGVSAYEFRRAVHRSVEVRFLLNFLATAASVRVADDPGVQVRVDGHLLARHGIQDEARRHFRDAPRARW